MAIFENHASLQEWLEAKVHKSVRAESTHLIKGSAATGNMMLKVARFWESKGTGMTNQTVEIAIRYHVATNLDTEWTETLP